MPYLSSFSRIHNVGQGNTQLEEYFVHNHFLFYQLSRQNIIDGCGIVGLHALSWKGTIYFHQMCLNFLLVV